MMKKYDLDAERAYWNERCGDSDTFPDIRRPSKAPTIHYIWNDPRIENILRGEYRQFIIQRAVQKKRCKALDIGCGSGWLSLELARVGMDVTGVDLSPRRIALAKQYFTHIKKSERIPGNNNYIAGSIHDMKFENSTFDLIFAWDALHHIPQIQRVTHKMAAWLKPSGELIIFEHTGPSFLNRIIVLAIYALPFVSKWNLLKKLKSKFLREKETKKAPSEATTQVEMVSAIRRCFRVRLFKTALAMTYYVAPNIILPEPLKYRFIHFLKRIDDALIESRLVRGEYTFMWAFKK